MTMGAEWSNIKPETVLTLSWCFFLRKNKTIRSGIAFHRKSPISPIWCWLLNDLYAKTIKRAEFPSSEKSTGLELIWSLIFSVMEPFMDMHFVLVLLYKKQVNYLWKQNVIDKCLFLLTPTGFFALLTNANS